eukprot:CAMPEP_0168610318 /NCGR_PEP_ID=MMETSP0449_2-20121227/1717_1 /TAXON_ID=1082188 /ORGANISM="Strombidium rassoulzadegani, Strain ras09" /LENGTH=52 /DNA_ID=CAMNT_0008650603 /DNA_START=791 /DNA_END=946 /DNA_ORIENTATION=-
MASNSLKVMQMPFLSFRSQEEREAYINWIRTAYTFDEDFEYHEPSSFYEGFS